MIVSLSWLDPHLSPQKNLKRVSPSLTLSRRWKNKLKRPSLLELKSLRAKTRRRK
jgi:hypothetical protein